MLTGDTIAAIATAPGRAGVAVVRVSGPEAFAVARALCGREVVPGRISHLSLRSSNGSAVDDAIVLAFASPHSYTGEDVVEFQCHGGSVTPHRVLEATIAAGARLARRGEFTERAFLNGKLDFAQAESVLALVDAKTARAADDALEGIAGKSRRATRELYERALELSVRVEHVLDVDESELPCDFIANLKADIAHLQSSLDEALRNLRRGKILRSGALVVLAGPPNVGKSSLMNALLGEGRAIVSEIAGTTRDSIEEWLDLDGWPVRLVDTAGLRETSDAIEAEGVARTRKLIDDADIILRLSEATVDAGASIDDDDRSFAIRTKTDLLPADTARDSNSSAICVSVVTGEGLDALRAALASRVAALEPSGAAEGHEGLVEARRLLVGGDVDDLVLLANRLRDAADCLGRQIGAVYSSDMLDRLFSRFCVGK